jgi:transketolase
MAELTVAPNYRKSVIDLLMPYATADERVVLLVGDMGFGAIERFGKAFPGRLFNSGIAEQGMVGIAAGMALAGLKPVVYHMPNFLAFRALEQIRNDVVLQNAPVKFIATGVNDYFKFLGQSHCCGQQDADIMRMIGMRVHDPYVSETSDFALVVRDWFADDQPAYLRV